MCDLSTLTIEDGGARFQLWNMWNFWSTKMIVEEAHEKLAWILVLAINDSAVDFSFENDDMMRHIWRYHTCGLGVNGRHWQLKSKVLAHYCGLQLIVLSNCLEDGAASRRCFLKIIIFSHKTKKWRFTGLIPGAFIFSHWSHRAANLHHNEDPTTEAGMW